MALPSQAMRWRGQTPRTGGQAEEETPRPVSRRTAIHPYYIPRRAVYVRTKAS